MPKFLTYKGGWLPICCKMNYWVMKVLLIGMVPNAEGGKSRMGIHILWMELFDIEGSVTTKKEPIIVAGKLE